MGDFRYKLQLTDDSDGSVITHEFNADLELIDLKIHLKTFLAACSYSNETIRKLFNE